MPVRRIVSILTLSWLSCAGVSWAASVDYTITFTGGGSGVQSIGPGSFSYDSMGMTSTTVGPPVTLNDYMVPVTFGGDGEDDGTFEFTFTQTSPEDDNAVIDSSGFVTAVSVDSNGDDVTGDMLFLNDDNTWQLEAPSTPVGYVGIFQPLVASGTYSISAPAGVPEPASLGLTVAGLVGLSLLRRKSRPRG